MRVIWEALVAQPVWAVETGVSIIIVAIACALFFKERAKDLADRNDLRMMAGAALLMIGFFAYIVGVIMLATS